MNITITSGPEVDLMGWSLLRTRCVWFATWPGSSRGTETASKKCFQTVLTKFWLDYPTTLLKHYLSVHSPSPRPFQCAKVRYHPWGEGLLLNYPYTIMDTHLTPFSSVYLSSESHTHTALVTWPALVLLHLSLPLLPFFPSLITVSYNSDLLEILMDVLGALQLLECLELWNWFAFVELELSTFPTLPVEPHRKGSACTLSLGVTSSIMEETWFKLIWQQECDCHQTEGMEGVEISFLWRLVIAQAQLHVIIHP